MSYPIRALWLLCCVLNLCGAAASGQRTARSATQQPASSRPTLALQVGHSQDVSAIMFSPDGKTVATVSNDNTVKLWDPLTGEVKRTLFVQYAMDALAFSPDGQTLAVSCMDGLRLWDVRTGDLKRTLRKALVDSLAFSPDGKTLAAGVGFVHHKNSKGTYLGNVKTGGGDTIVGEVTLWDAHTGVLKRSWTGLEQMVDSLVFSPGGTMLAGSSKRMGPIRLWDLRAGKLERTLIGRGPLAFSHDGKTLMSGGDGGTAQIWDVQTGDLKRTLPGVSPSTFSPEGRIAIDNGEGEDVRLWDMQTGERKRALHVGLRSYTRAAAMSPDGRTLAIDVNLADEPSVQLWDVEKGDLQRALRTTEIRYQSAAISPDGKVLATVSEGTGDVIPMRLWDLQTGALQRTFSERGQLRSIRFLTDGKTLAGSGWLRDEGWIGAVKEWNWRMGAFQRTHFLKGRRITPVWEVEGATVFSISPDGNALAYAHWKEQGGKIDGEVQIHDMRSGTLQRLLPGNSGSIQTMAFSPDGARLVTGGRDGIVRLWEWRTGTLVRTLSRSGDGVWSVGFSPDGRSIAAGGEAVRVWDARTGALRRIWKRREEDEAIGEGGPGFSGGTGPRGYGSVTICPIAFSPDGKTLACVGYRIIQLLDLQTGARKQRLLGHQSTVYSVAFSPGGRMLASAALDGTQRVWDVQTGRLLATLIALPDKMQTSQAPSTAQASPRPIAVDARVTSASSTEQWFVVTPEGYFDCSPDAPRFIKWNFDGQLLPAERFLKRFRRPDLVRRALKGEKILAPPLTSNDLPPTAAFLHLADGQSVTTDPLHLSIQTSSRHPVKQVEVYVNGRPLSLGEARPIAVDARPIAVDARAPGRTDRLQQTFTFRVSLPQGASEVHLRAVAYDDTDLGSDPVEIVLHRAGVREVAGNLYVLSVGVSHYKNGGAPGSGTRGQFSNLRFPAADARSIASRFGREGKPLYERIEVRTLLDEQATLEGIRHGLRWLQESVGPGQIDTVVIYLSGHGYSSPDGRYFFAPFDFDVHRVGESGLSGRELREALGGRLRAKRVFLFVDTCHAGGLGGRSEDLVSEVGEGVYVVASSGASEYAYESAAWGHGAFTLGLLRSLGKKELEDGGSIRFVDLVGSLRREVGGMLREAGRGEQEQEPCVPLAGRRLGEPVASAKP